MGASYCIYSNKLLNVLRNLISNDKTLHYFGIEYTLQKYLKVSILVIVIPYHCTKECRLWSHLYRTIPSVLYLNCDFKSLSVLFFFI